MSHKKLLAAAQQRPPFMEVLRLLPPYTIADVTRAYKEQARSLHPDAGGDPQDFKALHSAYELALDHARFQESRRTWLGTRVARYQQRQDLIAQIETAGGVCALQPIDAYVYEYGEDFADILRQLVRVRVTGPHITDASLSWLQSANPALAEVRLLDLSSTAVTDDGLQHLAALSGLRCADLRDTPVSAKGLDPLASLKELEWLHLGGTSVGALARRRLRKTHPQLTIASRPDETAPPADGPEYEHLRLQRRLNELGMLP
jgi:hypothetical protein